MINQIIITKGINHYKSKTIGIVILTNNLPYNKILILCLNLDMILGMDGPPFHVQFVDILSIIAITNLK